MEQTRSAVRPHGPSVWTDGATVHHIPWKLRLGSPRSSPCRDLPSLIGDDSQTIKVAGNKPPQTALLFVWKLSLSLFLSLYDFFWAFYFGTKRIKSTKRPPIYRKRGVKSCPTNRHDLIANGHDLDQSLHLFATCIHAPITALVWVGHKPKPLPKPTALPKTQRTMDHMAGPNSPHWPGPGPSAQNPNSPSSWDELALSWVS